MTDSTTRPETRPCVCGHPGGPDGVHEYLEDEGDPDEVTVCTVDGCDCTGFEETAEARRARRVEAFAARSARHRRWADAFVGDDDPIFAIACEVVDHEARLDALAEAQRAVEAQLSYVKVRLDRLEHP